MRTSTRPTVAIVVVVALAAIVMAPATVTNAQGPTQGELNAAGTNTTDWLVTNHDYAGQRYVDLDLISGKRHDAASRTRRSRQTLGHHIEAGVGLDARM